ncbi:hypothetical protein T439DRAFT_334524 [Meredithblackwellia eburnea MCA 4105]
MSYAASSRVLSAPNHLPEVQIDPGARPIAYPQLVLVWQIAEELFVVPRAVEFKDWNEDSIVQKLEKMDVLSNLNNESGAYYRKFDNEQLYSVLFRIHELLMHWQTESKENKGIFWAGNLAHLGHNFALAKVDDLKKWALAKPLSLHQQIILFTHFAQSSFIRQHNTFSLEEVASQLNRSNTKLAGGDRFRHFDSETVENAYSEIEGKLLAMHQKYSAMPPGSITVANPYHSELVRTILSKKEFLLSLRDFDPKKGRQRVEDGLKSRIALLLVALGVKREVKREDPRNRASPWTIIISYGVPSSNGELHWKINGGERILAPPEPETITVLPVTKGKILVEVWGPRITQVSPKFTRTNVREKGAYKRNAPDVGVIFGRHVCLMYENTVPHGPVQLIEGTPQISTDPVRFIPGHPDHASYKHSFKNGAEERSRWEDVGFTIGERKSNSSPEEKLYGITVDFVHNPHIPAARVTSKELDTRGGRGWSV